jgi:hypothetical protein
MKFILIILSFIISISIAYPADSDTLYYNKKIDSLVQANNLIQRNIFILDSIKKDGDDSFQGLRDIGIIGLYGESKEVLDSDLYSDFELLDTKASGLNSNKSNFYGIGIDMNNYSSGLISIGFRASVIQYVSEQFTTSYLSYSNNGAIENTELKHTISSKLNYVNITPKFGINIYGGFSLIILPNIQLNINNEFNQNILLSKTGINNTDGHNLVFNESNNYEMERAYDEVKDVAIFNTNIGFGAKYSLELSSTLILQTEAYYQLPITSFSEDYLWEVESYAASVGFSYRIPSVTVDDKTAPMLMEKSRNLNSISNLEIAKTERIAFVKDSTIKRNKFIKDSIAKEIELKEEIRLRDSIALAEAVIPPPPEADGVEGECWKLKFGSGKDKDWIIELSKELGRLDIETQIDEFIDERTGDLYYRVYNLNCWKDKESAKIASKFYIDKIRNPGFKLKFIKKRPLVEKTK